VYSRRASHRISPPSVARNPRPTCRPCQRRGRAKAKQKAGCHRPIQNAFPVFELNDATYVLWPEPTNTCKKNEGPQIHDSKSGIMLMFVVSVLSPRIGNVRSRSPVQILRGYANNFSPIEARSQESTRLELLRMESSTCWQLLMGSFDCPRHVEVGEKSS
jgi:hypothetical protein